MPSFALLTKWTITPTKADNAAAIHPNTGIDLIAAPTIRKAPARPIFAAVPATAAAVCAPVATVFAPWATVFPVCAAVFACCAAVLAAVAAVSAMVAVVSATVAAVDATCSPLPTANNLFHHSFNPLMVTSWNASSLSRASCTSLSPIVTAIKDCTLSIIFCKFSFSPLNKATAPCAAENAPETPESPDNKPSHILSPRFNIFCWVVTASIASDNSPICAWSCLYLSELVSPASSNCINSSRTSRKRVRKDTWDCAAFSASCAAFSIFCASSSNAFDWLRNSFKSCLRTVTSPLIASARSCKAR